MSEEESSYSEDYSADESSVPVVSPQRPQQSQIPSYQPPPQGCYYYYQFPQNGAFPIQPIPQPAPQPKSEKKRHHRKEKSPKEKKQPKYLTRGQRRYILSGFQKDQLAAMRLGKKSTFGYSKEQLVKSAVEITSTREDVMNLILSACDANEED